jgi:hypothetical protein
MNSGINFRIKKSTKLQEISCNNSSHTDEKPN